MKYEPETKSPCKVIPGPSPQYHRLLVSNHPSNKICSSKPTWDYPELNSLLHIVGCQFYPSGLPLVWKWSLPYSVQKWVAGLPLSDIVPLSDVSNQTNLFFFNVSKSYLLTLLVTLPSRNTEAFQILSFANFNCLFLVFIYSRLLTKKRRVKPTFLADAKHINFLISSQ